MNKSRMAPYTIGGSSRIEDAISVLQRPVFDLTPQIPAGIQVATTAYSL